jgi:hypothetical protein
MVTATINYGPIKQGRQYKKLAAKNDYVLVSSRGKPVYVPSFVFYSEQ